MKKICSMMILIGISSCYGANQSKKFTYDSLKKEFISSLKKVDDFHYSLGKINYYLEDSLIDLTQQELPEDKELRKNNRNYKEKGKQIIENMQKYAAESKENYKNRDGHWVPVSFIRGVDHAIGKHFPTLFDLVGNAGEEEIHTAIDIHRYINENKDLYAVKRELLGIAKKKSDQIAAYGILGYLSIFKMIQDADGFMQHTYDHVISDKTIKSEFSTIDLGDIKPQKIKSTGIAFFINNVHYIGKYKSNILFIPIHNKFDLNKDLTLNTAIASIYTLDSYTELECKFNPGRKIQGFIMPEKQGKSEYLTAKVSFEHVMNAALKKPHNLKLPKLVEDMQITEQEYGLDSTQDTQLIGSIQIPDSVATVNNIETSEQGIDVNMPKSVNKMCMQDTAKQVCSRIYNIMDSDIETNDVDPYRTKYINKANGDLSYYRADYTPSFAFKTDRITGMEQVRQFVKLLEDHYQKTKEPEKVKGYLKRLIEVFSQIKDSGTDDLSLLCEIGCINSHLQVISDKSTFFEDYVKLVIMNDCQRVFIETLAPDILNIFKIYPMVEHGFLDDGESGITKIIKRQSKTFAKKYTEYIAQKYCQKTEYYAAKKGSSIINDYLDANDRLYVVYNKIHDEIRAYCRLTFAWGNMVDFMESSINSNVPLLRQVCQKIICNLNVHLAELELNKYENARNKVCGLVKGDMNVEQLISNPRLYRNNQLVKSKLKNVIGLLNVLSSYEEHCGDLNEMIFIINKQMNELFDAMFGEQSLF